MFSKNLKYYRLRKSLTKKDLAELVGVSPMAITNYEKGERYPDMNILKKIAQVLDVTVSDFLMVRNENLRFNHGCFRKASKLSKNKQDYIIESVEDYLNRFMSIVEILGGEVLPDPPQTNVLKLLNDVEENAALLRNHLGLTTTGPVNNLIGLLENMGIIVYYLYFDSDSFSGINGFVNDRPYILINKKMKSERIRSTIVHELAHLMFNWPKDMLDKEIEEMATAISGAFLFPKNDAIRELGYKRSVVSRDMEFVAKEFGISMFLLVKRAQILGIISENVSRNFYIIASNLGWRKNEPSRIPEEKPVLFKQLVYRAINEEEISIQKGIELLKTTYTDLVKDLYQYEVE